MAVASRKAMDILSDEHTTEREEIVTLLTKAYWMEIETVMSYIANSVNPDGVRAQEIIESLTGDIQEELGHAQQFAAIYADVAAGVPSASPAYATFADGHDEMLVNDAIAQSARTNTWAEVAR